MVRSSSAEDGSTGPHPRPFEPIAESEPGMQIIHALRAVTVELNMIGADFAASHRLHATDLRAIIELLDAERAGAVATPGLLGERLGLNSASVTALVDRLEELGHVRRRRDPTDRRRVLLDITLSAKDLGWAFFGPLMSGIVAATSTFDETEIGTVRRFLETVREAAATYRAELSA